MLDQWLISINRLTEETIKIMSWCFATVASYGIFMFSMRFLSIDPPLATLVAFIFGIYVYHTYHDDFQELIENEMPVLQYNHFVYVLRRSDGIYKLGHTQNLPQRLQEHKDDYGMDFEPVKIWNVKYPLKVERHVLNFTRSFFYFEENRKELRKMTYWQLVATVASISLIMELIDQ